MTKDGMRDCVIDPRTATRELRENMGKKDTRIESPLAWDEYRNKSVEQALPIIYFHAQSASATIREWYWQSIRRKRNTSLGFRSATFVLLTIGTLFPILAALGDDSRERLQYTQLGVMSLALAGLLQVADKVFGWSSGWLRYITTAMAMENLARKFELDWASYMFEKTGDIGDNDKKALFDIALKFEQDTANLQGDETDKWVTEFSSSVALLGELIKSQRESGEKAVEAARAMMVSQQKSAEEHAKSLQVGSVEVVIRHKSEPVLLNISVDTGTAQEFMGVSWAQAGLTPGHHTISITRSGATPVTIQKIVEIKAGGIAHSEVQFS
jgi:hypothetical protein